MLIGYEAFRSLVFYAERSKPELSQVEMDRIKKAIEEYLLKPGKEMCAEASCSHGLKNKKILFAW